MPGFDTDGLRFFDLTQPYGHGIPQWPGGAAAARGLARMMVSRLSRTFSP
jgi:kynurenine formamidase